MTNPGIEWQDSTKKGEVSQPSADGDRWKDWRMCTILEKKKIDQAGTITYNQSANHMLATFSRRRRGDPDDEG